MPYFLASTLVNAVSTLLQVMPELSVDNFCRLATSHRFTTPPHQSYEQLEQIYWQGTVDRTEDPIYGADVQHTLIGGKLNLLESV